MQLAPLSKKNEQNYSRTVLNEILEMIAYFDQQLLTQTELFDNTFFSINSSNIIVSDVQ